MKYLQLIKKYPYMVVLIIVLFLYLPGAFSSPPETDKRAVITALAFDEKGENEIEASIVMLTPIENASFSETDTIVSATGDTVANTFLKLTLSIGKNLGLAHAEIVIVSAGLAEKNIAEILNHVARSTDISNNTPLIIAEGSAKELLTASHNLSKNTGLKLQQIIVFNEKFLLSVNTNLETFYKSYYSENQSSLLTYVKLKDSSGNGISTQESSGQAQGGSPSSDSQSQSSQSSQSHSQQNKLIDNDGSSVIMKNGKMVGILDRFQTRGVNWIDEMSNVGSINISGVNNAELKNAKMLLDVRNKKITKSTCFEENTPVIKISIALSLNVEEIIQDKNEISVNAYRSYIDENVRGVIEQKIKSEFSSALQIMKDKNADIVDAYELLYKNNRKEFKQYLESLENKDEFLDYISFRISVSCQEYK